MSIFEFSNIRAFLRHHLKSLPRNGYGEVNRIAEHLNVHPSYISKILSGNQCPNAEQGQEICEFLGLSPMETDYFILLIQVERAGTKRLKEYWMSKLEKLKSEASNVANRIKQDRKLTDYERSVFYSSWLYSAVRLFTSVGDGVTPEEITERFQLSRLKANEIVRFLVDSGLCVERDARIVMGPQRTHLEQSSPFISKHHTNWRVKSISQAENVGEDELMFTSPLSISTIDFAKLREKLIQFIQATSSLVSETEAEEVAFLNLDLLWVKK